MISFFLDTPASETLCTSHVGFVVAVCSKHFVYAAAHISDKYNAEIIL